MVASSSTWANIPTAPDVISIGPKDTLISSSTNDWVASWDRVWSKLATAETATTSPATAPPSSSQSPSSASDSGLATGAKAGIGAGVALAAIAVAGLGIVSWRRKRQRQAPAPAYTPPSPDIKPTEEIYYPRDMSQRLPPAEIYGRPVMGYQAERYELS